jgi:hypothetical protein
MMDRCLLAPYNPLDGDIPGWFDQGQFAGRKQHGADMLALILALIIQHAPPGPYFIILADFSKAYDGLWKEALMAKLATKGVNLRHLASIRALYSKLFAKAKDSSQQFFELKLGIPQGGRNSSFLWTTFIDDLPDDLFENGISTTIFGIVLACLIFMDDLAIPCSSIQQTQKALRVLEDYCAAWKVTFNLVKTVVLPIRNSFGPCSGLLSSRPEGSRFPLWREGIKTS